MDRRAARGIGALLARPVAEAEEPQYAEGARPAGAAGREGGMQRAACPREGQVRGDARRGERLRGERGEAVEDEEAGSEVGLPWLL